MKLSSPLGRLHELSWSCGVVVHDKLSLISRVAESKTYDGLDRAF